MTEQDSVNAPSGNPVSVIHGFSFPVTIVDKIVEGLMRGRKLSQVGLFATAIVFTAVGIVLSMEKGSPGWAIGLFLTGWIPAMLVKSTIRHLLELFLRVRLRKRGIPAGALKNLKSVYNVPNHAIGRWVRDILQKSGVAFEEGPTRYEREQLDSNDIPFEMSCTDDTFDAISRTTGSNRWLLIVCGFMIFAMGMGGVYLSIDGLINFSDSVRNANSLSEHPLFTPVGSIISLGFGYYTIAMAWQSAQLILNGQEVQYRLQCRSLFRDNAARISTSSIESIEVYEHTSRSRNISVTTYQIEIKGDGKKIRAFSFPNRHQARKIVALLRVRAEKHHPEGPLAKS